MNIFLKKKLAGNKRNLWLTLLGTALCSAIFTIPSTAKADLLSIHKYAYFSGTNQKISGYWYWPVYNPNQWFTEFWITVTGPKKQGEAPVTIEVFRESYGFHCSRTEFSCTFDTTEFAHGATLTVTTHMKENNGKEDTSDHVGRVWNKATTWKHYNLPDYENRKFSTVATQANYQTTGRYGGAPGILAGNTSKTALLKELPQYTVIHINSHGGAGEVSDLNAINYASGTKIDGNDIEEAIDSPNGKNGLHVKYPPFSFVFITACHALGQINEFNTYEDNVLFPLGFKIVSTPFLGIKPNQALIGFTQFSNGFTSFPWAEGVMENMFQGKLTVKESIDAATDAYGKPKGDPETPVHGIIATRLRATFGDDIEPKLYGDPKTKVKGLYVLPKGSVNWCRVETSTQSQGQ
jgi:hypothetical protein